MNQSMLFLDIDVAELCRGIKEESGHYRCVVCGLGFEKGRVYSLGDGQFLAEAAALSHVQAEHGGMLKVLMSLDKRLTGLSDAQKEVLLAFSRGLGDAEAGAALSVAASTIRNYRFQFRERAREARVYLAIASLIGLAGGESDALVPPHAKATMVDERYRISRDEEAAILREYFEVDPETDAREATLGPQAKARLKKFPRKEKRKIVALRAIASRLEQGRRYPEREISGILEEIWPDYALLRRYLVEYGFVSRQAGGGDYWLS